MRPSVTLHEGDTPLDLPGLIAAAHDVDLIIADRSTAVPGEVFAGLPRLKVVMRSAIDIRNIDVAAASKAGVLVTLDQLLQPGKGAGTTILPPRLRHVREQQAHRRQALAALARSRRPRNANA